VLQWGVCGMWGVWEWTPPFSSAPSSLPILDLSHLWYSTFLTSLGGIMVIASSNLCPLSAEPEWPLKCWVFTELQGVGACGQCSSLSQYWSLLFLSPTLGYVCYRTFHLGQL
jgi:hypothetical protein